MSHLNNRKIVGSKRLQERKMTKGKRAFLEASKITKANRDFRFASDAPFESLVTMDRKTARARARWLEANNNIMDNIDKSIINNVFGTGIILNAKNKRILKAWNRFIKNADISGRYHFRDLCKMMLKRRMVDGEIFIKLITTDDGLRLQLIEADRLYATSQNRLGMKINNATGEIEEYYFREINPDGSINNGTKHYAEPAENIINYHKANRPSQYRGITEYAPVILDIKNLSAFNSSTIESKRASASVAYAIKTTGDFGGFGAGIDEDEEQIQDVNGSSVYYLGAGEDITQLSNIGEGASYRDFSESAIRGIAVGRNISYEIANRDYSKVNFSSAKSSILQDYKRFDEERIHFTDYVLNVIYKRWFKIEKLLGNITGTYEEPEWNYPKREFVEPIKDMQEIEKKLELNMTSLSDVVKETTGRDLEVVAKQISEDKKTLEKYGLYTKQDLEMKKAEAKNSKKEGENLNK